MSRFAVHNYNQNTEHFHPYTNVSLCYIHLFQVTLSFAAEHSLNPGKQWSLQEYYIKRILWYITFEDWAFFSLSTISWRSIQIVTLMLNIFPCLRRNNVFSHSPIEGYYFFPLHILVLEVKLLWTFMYCFFTNISFNYSCHECQKCNCWVLW